MEKHSVVRFYVISLMRFDPNKEDSVGQEERVENRSRNFAKFTEKGGESNM